jgi:hypothetical protein
MKWTRLLAGALMLLFVQSGSASAESALFSDSKEGYEWLGPYAKLGLAIGFPDENHRLPDVDPGAGLDFAGGWRLTPWLAAEFDMNFIAGADVKNTSHDLSVFAATFNAKAYPLGALDAESVPFTAVQPYLLFGIGGGEVRLDHSHKSTFMARFGGGLDWWINEGWGAYFDLGYIVIEKGRTGLDGEGLLMLGAMYRF